MFRVVALLAGLCAAGPLLAQSPSVRELLDRAAGQDRIGDYRSASATLEVALAQAERESGPDSLAAARVCAQLSEIMYILGAYPRGRELGQRALSIYERASDERGIARALASIGSTEVGAGDYRRAIPLFERAVAIRERTDPGSRDLATTMNLLAFAYVSSGDRARGKLLAERVIAILEHIRSSDANAGQAYRILAGILMELGDYPGADRAIQQAVAIFESPAAHNDVRLGDLLITAGQSAKSQRRLEAAKRSFERAVQVYSTGLGPRNTRVGGALDELAQTLLAMKQLDAARETFQRALSIQTEALGPRSPWTANVIQGLAKVAAAGGKYGEAKRLFEQNLDIWREQLGSTHPFVVASLTNLAAVLARSGDRGQAFDTALEAARIRRDQIAVTVRTVEERQALRYAGFRMSSLDTAITLALTGAPEERRDVWDMIMRTRALVLDEMAARRRATRHSIDPQMSALAAELAGARSELARMVVQGKGSLSNAEYESRLEQGRARMQKAEQGLAVLSLGFRRELAQQRAGFAEVGGSLTKGSALIAYSRYEHADFARPDAPPVPSYVAFVLRAGEAAPRIVRIGPAAAVEAEVARWRREIDRERNSLGRNQARNEAMYRVAGVALRRSIWDPVALAVRGATRIYIVPDGALQLVNFAGLPSGTNRYLIDAGPTLHLLSAERDLASPETPALGTGLLAVGNPAYSSSRVVERQSARAVLRGEHSACGDFAQLEFEPLPGSEREIRTLADLWKRLGWKADVLSGASATEAAVKDQVGDQRVVHLATHGFFFEETCKGESVARENPLLRSGLALAGANRRNLARQDQEDGILTAEEAASLDLEGTEWVVLSGCDTGLGEVKTGEGVLGLRRAFQEAGARTVITSLWPVQDEEARLWMTKVYEHRFAQKQSTVDAMRSATLDTLNALRTSHRSTHPFHWASFIAVGDWR